MEVVVSIGLVAVISLFVIGVLSRLLTTGGKTGHQTAATLLAQELLETAVNAGPPRWGFASGDSTTWKGERQLLVPGDTTTTPFKFDLVALPLRKAPEDLGIVSQLTVKVWWWGTKDEDYRPDQGRTSVVASRTVYVRN